MSDVCRARVSAELFSSSSAAAIVGGTFRAPTRLRQIDPLPSWNDGAVKKSIIGLRRARDGARRRRFRSAEQRIATFDNDGTLWCEQPIYFQLAFALDRVKAMAPQHPEWKDQQPFKAVLDGDIEGAGGAGRKGPARDRRRPPIAGMTTDEFARRSSTGSRRARHPRFNRPYTELVYQPMLELLAYLRANGFKTFIVSGGGVEFMRPWMEKVYGIPPEQVVGSSGVVKFEIGANGKPAN